MTKPKIGIIISTTRESRFGDKVAQWVLGIAAARTDLDFEIVDLRDYPMPLFDEPMSPLRAPPRCRSTSRRRISHDRAAAQFLPYRPR